MQGSHVDDCRGGGGQARCAIRSIQTAVQEIVGENCFRPISNMLHFACIFLMHMHICLGEVPPQRPIILWNRGERVSSRTEFGGA